MPVSAARAAAFAILLRVETTDAYASELLHSSHMERLSPADHGLVTEIVMGVLRWRRVLDEQIAAHVSQPLAKFDAEVLTSLRIGAYQLFFLDRIPVHAAINESVELVKRARKRSAAGMVNAVLRKMRPPALETNGLGNSRSPFDSLPPVGRSGQALDSGNRFASESIPAARDGSTLGAHPEWLVERWNRIYESEAAQKICEYDQRAPGPVVRAKAALAEELAREGVTLEPGKLLSNAYVVAHGDITRTRAFREGRVAIQDEGSQLVALLLGNGERILDCCAAPGGKTRILAEENPNATVVAIDVHPHRAALLKRLAPLPNVHVVATDARSMPFARGFDRILVDAPCTGTGTLARNPEIKWRLKLEDIARLQAYQIQILSSAMKQLSPGGRLLYSTCSLEPEENEGVIEKALERMGGFCVLDICGQLDTVRKEGALAWQDIGSLVRGAHLRTIPGIHPCDGFFAALLEREM